MDVPVSLCVVERTACFHWLKVKDAPANGRQWQSCPEHGQDPDDGADGHRCAPEHLLLWKQTHRFTAGQMRQCRKAVLKLIMNPKASLTETRVLLNSCVSTMKDIKVTFYGWQMFSVYTH